MKPSADTILSFLGYTLDTPNAQLRRGAEVVPLRPKALAVLTYFANHPGRLITKAELLDALWPDTAVSESVLTTCIKELRRALDDDPRRPRAIETAHRHGYRFIAEVNQLPATSYRPSATSHGQRATPLIGRAADLATLEDWLQHALDGERQIGFIAGEPGIGKTTLVEEFLRGHAVGGYAVGRLGDDSLTASRIVSTARGQCIEQHGAGEPYLPVLDALGPLCAGEDGARLLPLLRRHAPAWLIQLPGLLEADEADALERRVGSGTGTRMPRELASFLEALPDPLILFLEDLHWSDHATLDLLSMLAQRHEPARLLVVGTYRPVDVVVRNHPLKTVHQQLRERGLCRDLWLRPLGQNDVAEYIDARWPGIDAAAALARTVYERTDGNPLFLVNVAEYLVATGTVAETTDGWILRADTAMLGVGVPLGLRQMISTQIERIGAAEREVLEAGSLVGRAFSAALVAAALNAEVVEVEQRLARLARSEHLVRAAGAIEWPDGTVAGAYELTHFLYRSVLVDDVPPARRRQLHGRIAARLEQAYGDHAVDIGSELAFHFEESGQPDRAVPYLEESAARAVRRAAAHEAVASLEHALALLDALPRTPERTLRTIRVCIALGAALPVLRGFAEPEIERSYLRARALSEETDDQVQLFQSLLALTANYLTRARLDRAAETAEAIERLLAAMPLPAFLFAGNLLVGMVRYHAGSLAEARRHLELAMAMDEVPLPAVSLDLHVVLRGYLALTLLHQGYLDQARERVLQAVARAADLGRPFDRGSAAQIGCFLYTVLRDMTGLARMAEQAILEGNEHGLPAISAIGTIGRGRVLVGNRDFERGIAMMHEGIQSYRASGQLLALPATLAALAEAYFEAGNAAQAAVAVAEARVLLTSTGEQRFEAELHRLEGEAHLQRGEHTPAEACFRRAVEVANDQGARWWELRATLSLARLWRDGGKRAEARTLLLSVHRRFAEGFDTPDLAEAKGLLDALGT